ncbi:hypothetical protein D3C87_846720 [compost metagenome]
MLKSAILKSSVIGVLALGVLISGCGTTPFFFPITDQERQQIAALRSFRTAVSSQTNRAMSIFQRDMLTMLSLKLPTEYGVDLTPYFIPYPKINIPNPPAGYQPSIDSTKQLVGFIVPSQMMVTAQVVPPSSQVGAQAAWQYNLLLQQTLLGQSGTLQVTTSGANWMSNNNPAGTDKPYYFGQKYTRLPDSVQARAELNMQQNAGKVTLNASLGSFQPDPAGSDLMLPQSLSFDGSIPGLSWNTSGLMSTTTAVKLQGSLTVQGNQGSDAYMVDATASNGDVNMRLLNEEKAIDLTFSIQGGKIKGQAKSRVDRRYLLADILQSKDGKVMIKYGDGSQEILF